MWRSGREPDQSFRPPHFLYHRCKKEDFEGDVLLPPRIRIDRRSVIWSKFSKAWDVIFDHPRQGIIRFIVGKLPRELPKEVPPVGNRNAPAVHCFFAFHDPLDDNYSHSEIRCSRGGTEIPKVGSAIIKKEFQAMMSQQAFLLLRPEI